MSALEVEKLTTLIGVAQFVFCLRCCADRRASTVLSRVAMSCPSPCLERICQRDEERRRGEGAYKWHYHDNISEQLFYPSITTFATTAPIAPTCPGSIHSCRKYIDTNIETQNSKVG